MKILFVYQKMMPFVENDYNLLNAKYDVEKCHFSGLHDIVNLLQAVKRCDMAFCWFGKLPAFFMVLFSKIFKKQTIVVSGGDDVANAPHIHYGMFAFWWKRWCPLFVFKYADRILCVSKMNQQETLTNAKAALAKVRLIYHGFNADFYKKNPETKKNGSIITVCRITRETLMVKGLNIFIKSAELMPECQFMLIGPIDRNIVSQLTHELPQNVQLAGGVYGEDLVKLCSEASVYVQVSQRESFGCALAEAMLCECVPVVSSKAALPEVVGDGGLYADPLTPQNVVDKIQAALASNLGEVARQRIKTCFPLVLREEALLKVINELAQESACL